MNQEEVIVYTSENCSQSNKVVELLNVWDINYKEKNISENKAYLRELQENGIYATPATFVDQQCILGFQKRTLAQALDQAI